MKLAIVICALGLFLIQNASCTNEEQQNVEYAALTNVHGPNRQKRGARWDFSNVSGNIHGITAEGDGSTRPGKSGCVDRYGNEVPRGLSFENYQGNIRDVTCYDNDGTPGEYNFKNVQGDISNVRFVSGNTGRGSQNEVTTLYSGYSNNGYPSTGFSTNRKPQNEWMRNFLKNNPAVAQYVNQEPYQRRSSGYWY